jgi:nucleoid DNA-binding protein
MASRKHDVFNYDEFVKVFLESLKRENLKISSKEEAKYFIKIFLQTIRNVLKDDKSLTFSNFGKFFTTIMPARSAKDLVAYKKGINRTIQIPETTVVRFHASDNFLNSK